MIEYALKRGSPTLRIELWAWLTEILATLSPRSVPEKKLLAYLPHLYADVRKNAEEAIVPFMIRLGHETMVKTSEELKNVLCILDHLLKTRECKFAHLMSVLL
ncbi:Cytoskeleton-associated protein 5 [Zootermopsis nevadensis]|uniref:Cytoskeleton-associated protein 5 n=1 Tax=Zootermopsis nevadensis TaxID=136037 RepID=A0A067RS63_ZOONE|nr:Cytoskeleton-associated protein 5 [Zootermopsis nevadensis]